MYRLSFIFLGGMLCSIFLFHPNSLSAANLDEQVGSHLKAATGDKGANIQKTDPRIIVAEIIKTLLTVVGMIFIALMVLAGYWRITAHGEEDKIGKSNKTMIGAVIGLAIVLMAYSITLIIAVNVQNVVKEEGTYGEQ